MNRTAIDQYARGIGLLSYATEGLTQPELLSRPGPGNWSTVELVAHLLDADLVIADRMKRVIAEENPPLVAFDENKWATRLHYEAQPTGTATVLFDLNRRHMLEVLRRLDDAAFQRTGLHSERGPLTLAQLVQGAADHLDHHLRFIYEKRQQLGRSIPARFSQLESDR
ncbi:MAG: DinB family protein [Planctomycetes bacterium]|nr:DinB family protein [Planctomycetota bacterium]